ncbi:uncharacterized protein LOC114308806 [Camellia sinensis]|uniref:uncharacterized protein LOC114308806 n=1 Tax=Camellia sinensis TaxID=4442 RepID=UPI0010362A3A|nr:uncharacterized protein LOC114308806 [Camellia sinensis]
MGTEHATTVIEEVDKLLEVRTIREVTYPIGLSDTVVVKKKTGSWHVCVDFIDLNKACLKDCFALLQINQLVDAIAQHQRMSFLDVYRGYHQITMDPADDKMTFLTPRETYYYKVMPFRLKNTGATYQRLVTSMFKNQLGKTMEVYIDNTVVKSRAKGDHLANLATTFDILLATNYFTKWVEAEPLTHVRDTDVKRFVWKNIITRFSIPKALISDNDTQFDCGVYRELCNMYRIRPYFSSPVYPQSNGQAQASNKVVLDGIKKHLEKAKGKWLKELPTVLWAHRTMPRKFIGETPFALCFGNKAIIPLEIGLPTLFSRAFDTSCNDMMLALDIDLLEECQDQALVGMI